MDYRHLTAIEKSVWAVDGASLSKLMEEALHVRLHGTLPPDSLADKLGSTFCKSIGIGYDAAFTFKVLDAAFVALALKSEEILKKLAALPTTLDLLVQDRPEELAEALSEADKLTPLAVRRAELALIADDRAHYRVSELATEAAHLLGIQPPRPDDVVARVGIKPFKGMGR